MTVVKVTIKKHGGDDAHSWAVFVNGTVVPALTGLNREQAQFYLRMIERDLTSAEERIASELPDPE